MPSFHSNSSDHQILRRKVKIDEQRPWSSSRIMKVEILDESSFACRLRVLQESDNISLQFYSAKNDELQNKSGCEKKPEQVKIRF